MYYVMLIVVVSLTATLLVWHLTESFLRTSEGITVLMELATRIYLVQLGTKTKCGVDSGCLIIFVLILASCKPRNVKVIVTLRTV